MTLQEKLQLSGIVSFTGILVVFIVLMLLIAVIGLFSLIAGTRRRGGGTGSGEDEDDAVYAEHAGDTTDTDEGIGPADSDNEPDSPSTEEMAAIMAAVTICMEGSGFRLRAIRRTSMLSPAWNVSGRREYLGTRL